MADRRSGWSGPSFRIFEVLLFSYLNPLAGVSADVIRLCGGFLSLHSFAVK